MISFVDLSSIANFLKIFIETIETVTSISDSMKSHCIHCKHLSRYALSFVGFFIRNSEHGFLMFLFVLIKILENIQL